MCPLPATAGQLPVSGWVCQALTRHVVHRVHRGGWAYSSVQCSAVCGKLLPAAVGEPAQCTWPAPMPTTSQVQVLSRYCSGSLSWAMAWLAEQQLLHCSVSWCRWGWVVCSVVPRTECTLLQSCPAALKTQSLRRTECPSDVNMRVWCA